MGGRLVSLGPRFTLRNKVWAEGWVGGGGVPEPSSCRGSQDRPQMPFQRQHVLSQRACQLLSSQQQRPFTPGTLPHTTHHGPAGGDCHNASHRSRLTGEDRPGLTAGTAEGL